MTNVLGNRLTAQPPEAFSLLALFANLKPSLLLLQAQAYSVRRAHQKKDPYLLVSQVVQCKFFAVLLKGVYAKKHPDESA